MKRNYRILIMPDSEPYQPGDAEDRDAVLQAADADGVWGFVLQVKVEECPHCGRLPEGADEGDWDEIDSCYGFIGADLDDNGMRGHLEHELAGQRDVPVYHCTSPYEPEWEVDRLSQPASYASFTRTRKLK